MYPSCHPPWGKKKLFLCLVIWILKRVVFLPAKSLLKTYGWWPVTGGTRGHRVEPRGLHNPWDAICPQGKGIRVCACVWTTTEIQVVTWIHLKLWDPADEDILLVLLLIFHNFPISFLVCTTLRQLCSETWPFSPSVLLQGDQRYLKPPRLTSESSQVSLEQEVVYCLCNSSGFLQSDMPCW